MIGWTWSEREGDHPEQMLGKPFWPRPGESGSYEEAAMLVWGKGYYGWEVGTVRMGGGGLIQKVLTVGRE